MQLAKKTKKKDFSWLGGGLVMLPRDAQKETLEKGKLFCPNTTNFDFFRPGSVRKFTDFETMGDTLLGTGPKEEETIGNIWVAIPVAGLTSYGFGELFASTNARSAQSLTVTMKWDQGFTATAVAKIRAQVLAIPTTVLSTSTPVTWTNAPAVATQEVTFYFQDLPALPVADLYFTIEFEMGAMPVGCTMSFYCDNGGSAIIARKVDAGAWAQAAEIPMKFLLQAGDPPVTGLHDGRFESPGPTQFYMGSCLGNLLAGDPDTVDAGGSWDDPIWTGGNQSRFQLWDFAQQQGLCFVADYAAHKMRAWDGVRGSDRLAPYGPQADADSTMQAAYRSPMTVARAVGVAAWDAVGLVQVLIVTTLRSGGFRATYGFVELQNATDNVNLTALAIDLLPAQFYFDIDPLATQVFCTPPGRGIFYKVPTASMTLTPAAAASNPVPNGTTAITIAGTTDAALEAQPDLETLFSLPTGYFTQQINVPDAKFLQSFSNSLCVAGDPTNPFSLYIAAQNGPNVFSEYGRVFGVKLDIEPQDGEPITGLKVADRALFVAKPHFLYRVDFTGDSNNPYRVTRVHGDYGTYSHWSMQVVPNGLLFLDDSGPALCFGTYSALAPGSEGIVNLFDGRIANELGIWWAPISQRALQFASSALESGFNRVSWTVATGNDSTSAKNLLLIYDYVQQQFSVRVTPASVLAIIGDESGFPRLWKGDYSGQAYKLSDDTYSATDQCELETPWLDLGAPSVFKDGEWLWLRGRKITGAPPSSLWQVMVYVDGNDPVGDNFDAVELAQVCYFDAADPQFSANGVAVRLAPRAFRKIKLRIFAPTAAVAAALDGFTIEYTPEGQRR